MKLSGLGIDNVKITSRENTYSGFLKLFKYTITHQLFNGEQSKPLVREGLLRPPSVGVLLYDPKNDAVVLVEQFRMGPLLRNEDPWLLEIVAGISEPNEPLEQVAIREIKEETGCKLTQLVPIFNFYLSPGASNEKFKLFCGFIDSKRIGGVFGVPEEGEDIKVHVLSFAKAYDMVENGHITNAPTTIALQWLKINHKQLYSHE